MDNQMESFRHNSTICITAFLFSTLGAEVVDPQVDSQYRLPNILVREAGTVPAGLMPGRQTLSREQIAEQPTLSAWELVARETPGIHISRRAPLGFGIGPGSAGGVHVRGSGSGQRSIVLIDGRPDTMGIFAHPLNDSYFTHTLSQIEVIRGPASLRFGNAAMAGAINLVPLRPVRDREGSFGLEFGRWNTQRVHGGIGGISGNTDYVLSGFRARSDGHRENSAAELSGTALRLGQKLGDHGSVDLHLRHSYASVEDPGTLEEVAFVTARGEALAKNSRVDRYGADLTLRHEEENLGGFVKAYMNYGDHRIRNGLPSPQMGTTLPNRYWYDSWDRTLGLWAEQRFSPAEWPTQIVWGADVREYTGNPVIRTPEPSIPAWRARNPERRSQTEAAAYAMLEQPLGDRLRGSGGLRYQNHQRFGGEWLPAAGLHYDATESGFLRLYAGKGHRSPSLAEQFIVPPANEALRAERLTHYEISWEQQFTETLEADLTVFYQDFENLIASESLTGDGRPPFQLKNTGAYSSRGAEASGRLLLPGGGTRLQMGLSWVDPDGRTAGFPLRQVTLGILHQLRPGTRADLHLRHGRDLHAGDHKENPMSNLLEVDLRLRQAVSQTSTLIARVDNLLDRSQEHLPGKPLPGRAVYIGFEQTF